MLSALTLLLLPSLEAEEPVFTVYLGSPLGGRGRSAVNVAWAAWYRVKYDATSPRIFLILRIVEAGHATNLVLTRYFIIMPMTWRFFLGDKFYRL